MNFKESFEKWELIITPFILVLALITLIVLSQSILDVMSFESFLLYPLFTGLFIGVIVFIILDHFWLTVVKETTGKFLRLPTYILILLAIIGIILINMGFFTISLIILMAGLGIMFALIIITSLVAFYRSYYAFNHPL